MPTPSVNKQALFSLNLTRWTYLGLSIFIIGFMGSIAWAMTASLASASIAGGKLVTEVDTQLVQHQSGGVVDNILIENGDLVEKGQVLMTLSDPILNSQLSQLKGQAFVLQTKLDRIEAQLKQGLISWSQKIEAITLSEKSTRLGEQKLLDQIRNAHDQHISSLELQIKQVKNEGDSYESWIQSDEQSLKFLNEEIAATKQLLDKGFASKVAYLGLKRHKSTLLGKIAEHKANFSRSKNKVNELQAKINAQETLYFQKAQEQKHQATLELDSTNKQITASKVLNDRIEIKAPVTGNIVNLVVHTKGGVIAPGSVIMEIVPNDSRIVAQVNISPKDIESVYVGLNAKVRLLSYSFRKVPAINGELINLSADSMVDLITGQDFYQGEIVLDSNDLKNAGIQLIPGMPVQTQIVLASRTVFDYLLSPITHSLERGMKEE